MRGRAFWFEILFTYALLFGANFLVWPEHPGFIGVEPHPYWLGVLLFSVRYGVAAGLGSGGLSAACFLFAAWWGLDPTLLEDPLIYVTPICFVLVGALLGAATAQARARADRLERAGAQQRGHLAAVQEELRTLRDVNRGLERRIVSRMATLVTLHEGARQLETVELHQLYPAIVRFIAKTLDADAAALYLKSGPQWVVCESLGWEGEDQYPRHVAAQDGIVGRAGHENRIVSVRDLLRTAAPTEWAATYRDALCAGPVRCGESGEVVGVVALQRLPLLQFHSATLNLFAFLLAWASRAVERAQYVQSLQAGEIVDPQYQLYSVRYLHRRAQQEFARSKTYSLPLCVAVVGIAGLESAAPAQRDRVLLAISQLLKTSIREMDVIARHESPELPLALLLATTSPAQAEALRARLYIQLDRLALHRTTGSLQRVRIAIGLGHFTPQSAAIDALFAAAAADAASELSRRESQEQACVP